MSPLYLRASDDDRERVVDELRRHAAEGRLSVDELEERIERALSARTRGELAVPMRDGVETAYPDYFESNPDYQAFADQAARTVEVPNVPGSIEIWQEFRNAYSNAVIFGKDSVENALQTAADKADELAGQS